MKRISIVSIFILIALLITSMSCFEDRDDYIVRINVGNSIPGDVDSIHIGVYDGTISKETLLTKTQVDPGSTIEMNVPSGSNRVFQLITTNASGYAVRIAVSGPVDINGSEEITLQPVLININTFNAQPFFTPYDRAECSWLIDTWYEEFELQEAHAGSTEPSIYDETIYFNRGQSYIDVRTIETSGTYWYRVRAYSSSLEVYTVWLSDSFQRV